MHEPVGRVYRIATDNQPIPGCTTSKLVVQAPGLSIMHFSLAARTDISAETYQTHKLLVAADNGLEVAAAGKGWRLSAGQALLTPTGIPVGMSTQNGCVYTEIELKEGTTMNEALKAGEVVKLADLLPYQDGKIVNMDLASNDKMKFVLMSFDEGTGLTEHAAPGDAIIFALEGSGIIGYEGKEHPITAGQNFRFAKNGKHYVKADGRFKMALLLVFE